MVAARFLSAEWAEQVTAAIAERSGADPAMTGVELAIQFEVEQAPDGSTARYYLDLDRSVASVRLGTVEHPDLTVRTEYATASAISQGTLKIQTAFFSGKLSISGNVAKLLLNQRALDHLADAVSDLEVEY